MVKLIHWCALRISDFARLINSTALFNLGGSIECWADERIERKRWLEWGDRDVTPVKGWLAIPVPEFDPSELVMPHYVTPRRWPEREDQSDD